MITLGAHNISQPEAEGQVVMVSEEYILHPNFQLNVLVNDISLVRLPLPVEFTDHIQPIKLPTMEDDDVVGRKGILAGWGVIDPTRPETYHESDVLMEVELEVSDRDKCAYLFSMVNERNICTSGMGPVGACAGDSGGALVSDGEVIGIVSYGTARCITQYPTVFTRVSSFKDWIYENTDLEPWTKGTKLNST